MRRVVKQAHGLLLRNPTNVKTPAYKVRIDEVLAANQSLMTVYVIKEQLKMLDGTYRQDVAVRLEPMDGPRIGKRHPCPILLARRYAPTDTAF